MGLIRDSDLIINGEIPVALIRSCIKEHQESLKRLDMLSNYYYGEHAIKNRVLQNTSLPNNKLVCNHAEYITDMATGYFLGNPVIYKLDNDKEKDGLKVLTDNFKDIDAPSHDTELARDLSVYGLANELAFASDDDSPIVDLANISPRCSFVVCDDTVKHRPLFGVHYYPKMDTDGKITHYTVNVYTSDKEMQYKAEELLMSDYTLMEETDHYFDMVPLIEYKNKRSMQGDFEQVISLIDAYNLLQSDRVNDKEQLVDALLVITGASLGDDEAEVTKTAKKIKELKLLELQEGSDAKWLIKNLNETEVEILKKSLKDDIHEFSKVPCLTDDNFGSQVAGVALAYKLLAFEMLTKQKESWFRKGIKQRLKLMANFYSKKAIQIDPASIDIEMKRSLPVNRAELVNMVVALDGVVTDETRLGLLDFIDDPAGELKKLKVELQEKIKLKQQEFGSYLFKQGGGVGEETD
jgi:SPP1 family phage portal protein